MSGYVITDFQNKESVISFARVSYHYLLDRFVVEWSVEGDDVFHTNANVEDVERFCESKGIFVPNGVLIALAECRTLARKHRQPQEIIEVTDERL